MVLFTASIVLILISSFLTYRFLFLQDMASEIRESRIYEINDLKDQVKILNLDIDKLKEEKSHFQLFILRKYNLKMI